MVSRPAIDKDTAAAAQAELAGARVLVKPGGGLDLCFDDSQLAEGERSIALTGRAVRTAARVLAQGEPLEAALRAALGRTACDTGISPQRRATAAEVTQRW